MDAVVGVRCGRRDAGGGGVAEQAGGGAAVQGCARLAACRVISVKERECVAGHAGESECEREVGSEAR